LTLTVLDRAGVVLAAAQDVAVRDPEPITADAARFAGAVLIDEDSDEILRGTVLKIGREYQTVKSCIGGVVSFELVLTDDHAAGDLVYFPTGEIDVDLSDTDTFPGGLPITLIWTPEGTGAPITELAEVEAYAVDVIGFADEFRTAYRRAYSGLTKPEDRLADTLKQAQRTLAQKLRRSSRDMSRIRDTSALIPSLMALCAIAWTRDGDDDLIEERKEFNKDFGAAYADLVDDPIWEDADGDLAEEESETADAPAYYGRVW
jgi:hypothetical protein